MGDSSRVNSYEDARRALQNTRTSEAAFQYSARQSTRPSVGKVHDKLNPLGVVRECRDTVVMPKITPIVFAFDNTRSRGKDAKLVYEQMLPLHGALYMSGAVVDPQFLFMCFGDAKHDRAPIQVGQFESDERMDQDLERMWLEEGGGGTGEESSELAAYFIARKTKIDACDKRKKKGFAFISTDEAPYPVVAKDEVKRIFGDDLPKDIPTKKIFAELQKKAHTYVIYPASTMEARQDDIDAEIQQRLLKAGGRFKNCSIRASLIWHTYDDLDLHVVAPNGQHIYYASKQSTCGGELDVDRNAGGPQTREPVENIRWAKGAALPGEYLVFVRLYNHHERVHEDIPFKVELDIDGKIEHFTGIMKRDKIGERHDMTAFKFDYKPDKSVAASREDREEYTEEVILGKWRQYIPDSHIIRISDARWTTEVAIGIMAMQSGKKNLEGVIADMRERAVDPKGIKDVKNALEPLAKQGVFAEVADDTFA